MRSVQEWIGKTDDSPVPDRVRVRVWMRDAGRCSCCGRLILVGEPHQLDHKVALINGGQHRESNLTVILTEHHKAKTKADVALKSKVYQSRKRHLGMKKSKHPLIGSKQSGWKHKMDGTWVKR